MTANFKLKPALRLSLAAVQCLRLPGWPGSGSGQAADPSCLMWACDSDPSSLTRMIHLPQGWQAARRSGRYRRAGRAQRLRVRIRELVKAGHGPRHQLESHRFSGHGLCYN